MKHSNNLSGLFKQRTENQISREEYWIYLRDFLLELDGFSELLGIHGNKIVLSENDIIVEMKVAKTNESQVIHYPQTPSLIL